MQVISALLVDEVVKHPEGRVDLLGLFEDIYFEEVPVTLESISLYVDFELSEADKGKEHVVDFRIVDEDNQPIQEAPTKIRFSVPVDFPRDNAQLDMALFAITFQRFGAHYIELWHEGVLLRRLALHVNSTLRPSDGEHATFASAIEA